MAFTLEQILGKETLSRLYNADKCNSLDAVLNHLEELDYVTEAESKALFLTYEGKAYCREK